MEINIRKRQASEEDLEQPMKRSRNVVTVSLTSNTDVVIKANDNAVKNADKQVVEISNFVDFQNSTLDGYSLIWHSSTEKLADLQSAYWIIANIGSAGSYRVFYACRKVDKKLVVLKVVKEHLLLEVAHHSIRTSHPNIYLVPTEVNAMIDVEKAKGIVQCYAIYRKDEANYILILEALIGSINLDQYLTRWVMVTEATACIILQQIIVALLRLVIKGRLHFNLKSEHIMYDPETNKVTLIDFAGAQHISDNKFDHFNGTERLYPPESRPKHLYDCKPFETWCLGLILLQMTTGTLPVTDDVQENSKRVYILPDELSPPVRSFINECLSRNPKLRPRFGKILEFLRPQRLHLNIGPTRRYPMCVRYRYEF